MPTFKKELVFHDLKGSDFSGYVEINGVSFKYE